VARTTAFVATIGNEDLNYSCFSRRSWAISTAPCLDCVQACPRQNVGILRVLPGGSLREDRRGSGIGQLNRRPDVAALVLILVFGAFVNAAGMTEPVMMWIHHWHVRLGLSSMVPIVTALYVGGLLIIPGI
jgi:hypothetical protein